MILWEKDHEESSSSSVESVGSDYLIWRLVSPLLPHNTYILTYLLHGAESFLRS
jgi:hypothetical protein